MLDLFVVTSRCTSLIDCQKLLPANVGQTQAQLSKRDSTPQLLLQDLQANARTLQLVSDIIAGNTCTCKKRG